MMVSMMMNVSSRISGSQMQSGSGVLLHRFEMFIASVNGKETILVIIVDGWDDGTCVVELFEVIIGNFLSRK
jgi:hypothetical protein